MAAQFPLGTPHWNNLKIIHENVLPPRSRFWAYQNKVDALIDDFSKAATQSLNGMWKFSHAWNPLEAVEGFEDLKFDASDWAEIRVPGIWQLQGYGIPQYSNINYTFPVDPPNVPYEGNETGSYLTKFTVHKDWINHKLRVRFDGVDASFKVWLNGMYVGYSEGSRNPSEFDITNLVQLEAENSLAVQVYKWCNGSYLEDQDQWRFSGIFRDVTILAFPVNHIEDLRVVTILDDDYMDAVLKVHVKLSNKMKIELQLFDATQHVIASVSTTPDGLDFTFEVPIETPEKWSCDNPYLYRLVLSYPDGSITQRVGFRCVEIKNGILLVNGMRIVFRGVNRHEHHPESGRAVPLEFLKKDLMLMKRFNINAIRTCHQPSAPELYDLADELGLWIIDEADVECHGFEEIQEAALTPKERELTFKEKKVLTRTKAAEWTTNNPEWEAAYLDRAKQLIYRDKNHPCVILWSMGNEAFYGRNFKAMYDLIKSYDDTRPVHYEADHEAISADVYSCMYPEVDEMIDFVSQKEHQFKPLILCEFIHSMGNGPGGIKEYVDAFYKYSNLQGGCAWEWANHGLKTCSSTGDPFYAYGGDFGDIPNDSNFVMDGLIFSNHQPSPALIEYKKAIEPVFVVSGGLSEVKIVNRYDTISLDHLKCVWSLIGDGFQSSEKDVSIPIGILPSHETTIHLPNLDTSHLRTESYLQLRFLLKEPAIWGPKDHEVAWDQINIVAATKLKQSLSPPNHPPAIEKTKTSLKISGISSTWEINLISGTLSSWKKESFELIHAGPIMDFYRAPTDNDSPGPQTDNLSPSDGANWRQKRLHQTKEALRLITWGVQDDLAIVTVQKRVAPPVLEWSIDTKTTYTFNNSSVLIKVNGVPQGINLPTTLARVGLTMSLNPEITTASWFGRGPGESYRDKKLSQRFGNWTSSIDDLFTDYEYPQESANRTDIRWVALSGLETAKTVNTLKASFGNQVGCSFMASHYKTDAIEKAKHPYELHKEARPEVVLRLDWQHHGLGTGSCGPKTMEKYSLFTKPFQYEVLLE